MTIMGYWQELMRRSGWPGRTYPTTYGYDHPKGDDIPEGRGYRDPKCPKCEIILGNKMMYVCRHTHCPVGLN
jgi:hypothetical protein